MTLLAIDHVQLAMPAGREPDARAFYAGILGLTEVAKPDDLAKRGGCWFESAAVKVHLGVDPDFHAAAKAHPAFLVDDVKRLEVLATKAGYRTATDVPLEGYERIHVYDPFGNRIELMQKVAS
ncbi:VOC family protein [Mesorhizobium sp. NPDC059025]|uniref:VOC family protein n=1 Tax=unclassified Mesorhizobium TaxID=325217 RepID=UPI0036904A18